MRPVPVFLAGDVCVSKKTISLAARKDDSRSGNRDVRRRFPICNDQRFTFNGWRKENKLELTKLTDVSILVFDAFVERQKRSSSR